MTDYRKRILFISPMYAGSVHDFTIFKAVFSGMGFSWLTVWVDSGFTGIDKHIGCENIFIPFKNSKHHPLDETAKEYNSIISSIRVKIEHAMANLKSFFVLRHKNRMRTEAQLNDAFTICAGIANFRLGFKH
ncbi:transposase family protein [Microcoleus sp. herbarium7]|uniref:transposase family protein n=1 Tax=Microcoleus sp. herbarium7 TaxID=3055435 RepID=UPI002FD72C58